LRVLQTFGSAGAGASLRDRRRSHGEKYLGLARAVSQRLTAQQAAEPQKGRDSFFFTRSSRWRRPGLDPAPHNDGGGRVAEMRHSNSFRAFYATPGAAALTAPTKIYAQAFAATNGCGIARVLYNIKYSMLKSSSGAGETDREGDLDEGQDDIAGVDRG
jgi:hypothetical protein